MTDHSSDNALVWTLRALVVAALGMTALLALVPAAGHDQLWFLMMGERWLHGAKLYGPEIFDSNTPMIVWLSAIPAGLAGLFRSSSATVAKLLVVVLEIGIGWFLLRILPNLGKPQKLFLAFAFVCLFGAAAARDFGQRDQLAGLLLLPYIFLASQDVFSGKFWSRALAGWMAGVGVCLKPQLALVPIFIETALLVFNNWPHEKRGQGRLRSLWRRPEPEILVVVGLLFLFAIKLFAPLYFSLALPTLLSSYWAIGHLTGIELFRAAIQLHLLELLTLSLFVVAVLRRAASPLVGVLIVAGSASVLAYNLQGTGWYYQQLPAIGFFGLAASVQIVALTANWQLRIPKWAPIMAAGLTILALGLAIHFSGYPFSREMFSDEHTYAIATPDPSFFSGLAAGTPVATLTTSVDDAMMPIARYHLTWTQRTNNLWLLPAIFRAENPSPGDRVPARLTPARLAELSALQRRWMVEDLQRWQPKQVLVARCEAPEVQCQELENRHDNLLAFFLADPAFSELWSHYRFVRRSGPYDAFALAVPF